MSDNKYNPTIPSKHIKVTPAPLYRSRKTRLNKHERRAAATDIAGRPA